MADVNEDGARAIAGELDGLACAVDVADAASVRDGVALVERELGPVEVLVNNAGTDRFAFFVNTDEELWDLVLGVNLRGVIAVTHAVLPGMQERRAGAIVNVASEAGRVGSQGSAVYSAAKAGVIGFTKAIAREAARYRVRCNAVAPGPIETPLLNAAPAMLGELGERLKQAMVDATALGRSGRAGGGRRRDRLPGLRSGLLRDRADAERQRRPVDVVSGPALGPGAGRSRQRLDRAHPRGRPARRLPERAGGDPDRAEGRADRGARATGLRRLEVTSFVRPDVIPQLADAEQVLARDRRAGRGERDGADPQRARASTGRSRCGSPRAASGPSSTRSTSSSRRRRPTTGTTSTARSPSRWPAWSACSPARARLVCAARA